MKKYISLETYEMVEEDTQNVFEFDTDESFDSIEIRLELLKNNKTLNMDLLEKSINEIIDENEEEVEKFEISHWVSNRSFGELKDMYQDGEINVPVMQRDYIWTPQQSSRLIESIIMGLPIPPLFLLETERNKYEVIDGLQRLTTITNYMMERSWKGEEGRPAKLSGNILSSLKGKSYSQLEREDQTKIKRSTIPLIEFKQFSPENKNAKFLIFERINTGSQKLTPMQVRKALNYGKLIEELYELKFENDVLYSKLTKKERKDDGFEELVLRGIVLSELINGKIEYKKSMKELLNNFIMDNGEKQLSNYNTKEKLHNLNKILMYNANVLASLNSQGDYTNRVNKSIFDSLYSALPMYEMSDEMVQSCARNIEEVVKKEFFIDGDIDKGENKRNIFKYGTNNQGVINTRMKLMETTINDK